MPQTKKILPIIFFLLILSLIIWQVQPPSSLTSANALQVLLFFIPLFGLLIFTTNLIFGFYLKSLFVSLGVILLLIFQALSILNIFILAIIFIAIFLIIKSLKNPEKKRITNSKIGNLSKRVGGRQNPYNPKTEKEVSKDSDTPVKIPKLSRLK